jgi:hypothetical protein
VRERLAETAAVAAQRSQDAAEESHRQWAEVDGLRKRQSRVLKAAERKDAEALIAEDHLGNLREELRQFEAQRSVALWRAREKRQESAASSATTRTTVSAATAAAVTTASRLHCVPARFCPGLKRTPGGSP